MQIGNPTQVFAWYHFHDLKWPVTQISRLHHYLILNVSETAWNADIITISDYFDWLSIIFNDSASHGLSATAELLVQKYSCLSSLLPAGLHAVQSAGIMFNFILYFDIVKCSWSNFTQRHSNNIHLVIIIRKFYLVYLSGIVIFVYFKLTTCKKLEFWVTASLSLPQSVSSVFVGVYNYLLTISGIFRISVRGRAIPYLPLSSIPPIPYHSPPFFPSLSR